MVSSPVWTCTKDSWASYAIRDTSSGNPSGVRSTDQGPKKPSRFPTPRQVTPKASCPGPGSKALPSLRAVTGQGQLHCSSRSCCLRWLLRLWYLGREVQGTQRAVWGTRKPGSQRVAGSAGELVSTLLMDLSGVHVCPTLQRGQARHPPSLRHLTPA